MKNLCVIASAILLVLATTVLAANEPLAVQPFENNSVIVGKLSSDPNCVVTQAKSATEKNAQVWVSVGQILLYQVEVPDQGSFEFHVVPGKYDLVASNSKGCLVQVQLTTSPKEVVQANLKLAPTRAPAAAKN